MVHSNIISKASTQRNQHFVRCYRISSLRENHKQGLGLGFSTFDLELPLPFFTLFLFFFFLWPIGALGSLFPVLVVLSGLDFLGADAGQSLGPTSAQGFHPLILLSTTHWGDSPGVF